MLIQQAVSKCSKIIHMPVQQHLSTSLQIQLVTRKRIERQHTEKGNLEAVL